MGSTRRGKRSETVFGVRSGRKDGKKMGKMGSLNPESGMKMNKLR